MGAKTEMISIDEAARQLQTTPLNILMHLKRGLLKGVEENELWQIEAASLAELRAKTGGGKAANVCASGCSKKHGCSSCG